MSNLQKFNTTLEDFDKEVGKLKAVSEAYQKLENLTQSYDEISNHFKQNNQKLANINQSIDNSLASIGKLVEEKTDLIRKENKEFYRDLENTIKLKLNDNKSEIKQHIESERNQIKQIFEIEFAKNTKELRQVIENATDKQTEILQKNQKGLKIVVWVLGGISIILSGLVLTKLLIG